MAGRWWRRERLAIVLLPIALIAAVVGTGSRVDEYWWSRGFHEKASVNGSWAQIDDKYDDGHLTYPIRAEVKMGSVRAIDEVPGATFETKVASGGQLWEVTLQWKADPDVALTGCKLAIFDSQGARYDAGASGWDAGSYGFRDKCLPDETPGPRPQTGSTEKPKVPDDEDPRPMTWQSTTYVVTKAGIRPDSVRIWYFLPRYAELAVDSKTSARG